MREKFFEEFLKAPLSKEEREELNKNREKFLNGGNFDGEPEFGTGGMRATVALGTNHLNRYTIARLTLALSSVLKNYFPKSLVVLAYDSRISSVEFSRVTYFLLKSKGHEVKVFQRPTPTPFLSFAVRELNAQAGVVITASHNPPEYNGYKVYWSDGAQIVPPVDREIQKQFQNTSFSEIPENIHEIINQQIPKEDLIEQEILNSYLKKISQEPFISSKEKEIRILYSPLFGTGGWVFEKVFQALGFKNFQVLEEQKEPNGNFPGLKSANPEDKEAFSLLLAKGQERKADLLLATDPDADRLGCAVLHNGEYVFLNGNQIGSLLLESIARKKAKQVKEPYLCKTIVTTELQRYIGKNYGIKTYETLTGFKYIAEILGKDPENYIFGGEESYGYLPVTWIRDKDSLSSALALCELANENSLLDSLYELYLKHGLYVELLYNIHLKGDKQNLMPLLLKKLKNPAALFPEGKIGERAIADILDLQEGSLSPKTDYAKELKEKLPAGVVIQYWLEPEGRLTIRPSGTEPKVKVYLSLRYSANLSEKEKIKEAQRELEKEGQEILKIFLEKLGI